MSKQGFFESVRLSAMALVLLLLITTSATAQVTTGNLQVVVVDQNKAAVAGAVVKLTNTETGIIKETTTNEDGFYRFTFITPGERHRLDVSVQGFTNTAVENASVRLGVENSADVALGIEVTGEVTVSDEASLIDAAQSQLSTNYNQQQISELPFSGSIDQLALLKPGVVPPESDTDFTNGQGISANGNRPRSNNFQIDGQDNNDQSVSGPSQTLTNQEAVAEYQVITNNFSAEFGRNTGAQINVITKSGTIEFHGLVFEFHQNPALNARDNLEKKLQANLAFLANNGFSAFAAGALGTAQTVPAGSFIIFDTRQPGSRGTIVPAAQAFDQARLIYNDLGHWALKTPEV